ncbi:hypothetical protein FQN50_006863 [Emmonsiellopsis sp. PD_5]|nr:hypothetical protein FQN50_006863 [Emmonsiellopsis sp. PD_5]
MSPHHTAMPLLRLHQWHSKCMARLFSCCSQLPVKQMPPRPKIDLADVTGSYLKGTGPGGQAINKTNSAVQLIHKPTGIVVKSQETRSRSQNQKIALRILAEKVELLEKGDKSRVAVKAETKKKRKASSNKKSRRKYRKLEEEKERRRQEEMGIIGEEGVVAAVERGVEGEGEETVEARMEE